MAAPLLALLIGAAGRKAAMEGGKQLVKRVVSAPKNLVKEGVKKSMGEMKAVRQVVDKEGKAVLDKKGNQVFERNVRVEPKMGGKGTNKAEPVSAEKAQRMANIANARADRIAGNITKGAGTAAVTGVTVASMMGGGEEAKAGKPKYESQVSQIPTPATERAQAATRNDAARSARVQAAKDASNGRPQGAELGAGSAASSDNTGSAGTATSAGKSKIRAEFEKAFASARKAGDKEFEFRGKKYNTKMASEK